MARRASFAISIAAILFWANSPGAQTLTLEDLESDALERSGIANIVPSLGVFGVTPGARGARVSVDAAPFGRIDVDLFKVPLAYEFEPVWRGVRPHVQLALGRFEFNESVEVAIIPAAPTGFGVSLRGETVIAGLGATIPLSKSTSLRPMVLGGYARLRSEATTDGPFSGLLLSVVDGILADATLASPVVGLSLDLRNAARLDGGIEVDSGLRTGLLYAPVTRATNRVIDQAIPFPAISAEVEARGPLWQADGGTRLQWLGFGGISYIPALPDDVASLPLAGEVGIGLTVFGAHLPNGLTLRASGILGANVVGWSLGASVEY